MGGLKVVKLPSGKMVTIGVTANLMAFDPEERVGLFELIDAITAWAHRWEATPTPPVTERGER